MATFDHFGERCLKGIVRELMIPQNTDQEPQQLLRVLLEKCRDDCGIEFAFVSGAQSGVPAVSSLQRLPYGMRECFALLGGGANFFQ